MALIPYADESSEDDAARALVQRLPEPRINLFRMLANSPALAGPALRLGEAILTKGELDPRLRELVILHTAQVTQTEYEWVQHEGIARLIGLPEPKLEAVRTCDHTALDETERLALRIAGDAIGGTPAAEDVRALAERLGRAATVELLLVAGYYAMLGGLMRAVALDVDNVLEKGMLDAERLGGGR